MRRRAAQVATGAQAQVAPAGHRALHQPLTAPLAGAAILTHRVRHRGQRTQPDVVARRQLQRPARAQLCPVQRDIVPRLQRQPALRRYQPGLPDIGARQRPAAPPVLRRRLPLVTGGGVGDVAADARQRHRVALNGGAAVGQVAQRHQIQRAARVQQPALTVGQVTSAGDSKGVLRRHRATAVVDVPARAQAHAVRHDAAALQVAPVRLRQIQLRRQHRLPADANVLPPHQAVAQPRHLRRRQAHPQLQTQPAFLRRRVVHQLLHLRQVRPHAVQVALPGLAQHRVADIAGVKRRVPQKAVVVLRVQIQLAQQVGRPQHLRRVGQRRAGFHRHRGARRLPQQAAQVVEQAVVHLTKLAQRRVGAYQVAAVAGGIRHEQPVLAGRQRVVGQRRAAQLLQPLGQCRLQLAEGQRCQRCQRGSRHRRGAGRRRLKMPARQAVRQAEHGGCYRCSPRYRPGRQRGVGHPGDRGAAGRQVAGARHRGVTTGQTAGLPGQRHVAAAVR